MTSSMNSRRKSRFARRLRNSSFLATLSGVLAGAIIVTGSAAHAAEVCPARPQPPTDGQVRKRVPGKMSPMARRMYQVDQAYDAGHYDVAESLLQKLVTVPRDKNDTAHRAYLKLARVRVQQDRLDDAEAFVLKAQTSKDPRVRDQARYMLSDIAYRRGINEARAKYDQADTYFKNGDLDTSEASFRPLLDQPCPVPQAYSERVKLKLAAINLKKGQLDDAQTWLAQVDRSADPDLATAAAGFDASLAQKRVDVAARAAFDAADQKVDTGDFAGAVAADNAALTQYGNASPPVVVGGRLNLADHLSLQGRFDEARAVVQGISLDGSDPNLVDRRARIAKRIDDRQMDAMANEQMRLAEKEIAASHPQKALAIYDGMVTNPGLSPEWHQRAQLRRASIQRKRFGFSAAKADIDAVLAAPATFALASNAQDASATLAEATPVQTFLVSGGVGMQYDDNAPAVVSAIPGEDGTVPYPSNQKFADGATTFEGDIEYRHRLSGSYNYFTAEVGVNVVDQWSLNPLDRAKISSNIGGVFYLPSQAAKLETGLMYNRVYRGGDYLSQGGGAYLTYTRFIGSRRLIGHYEVERLDDTRVGRDSWRQTASLQSGPSGRYGVSGGLIVFRDNTEDESLRQTALSLNAAYDWKVKTLKNWVVNANVNGSIRRARYDAVSLDDFGNPGHRSTTRTRLGGGISWLNAQNMEIGLEYVHLELEDSSLSYNRSDNQINLSVTRRF
ncbi:MAG: hypothetical protein QM647_02630 [Asticcacaulis sp.]|uniref:tetratricopeptide repeat protein n=1 Tax=Asticcacaulis sp. TaxID=1872648 RepID=UPI0039E34598